MIITFFSALVIYRFCFDHRKRREADKIRGDRNRYVFDLDHNRYSEEGPAQSRYSVNGYTKGTSDSPVSIAVFSPEFSGRELGSLCEVSTQVLWAYLD